jgi:uncharacterized FlaG/YvyC family protein
LALLPIRVEAQLAPPTEEPASAELPSAPAAEPVASTPEPARTTRANPLEVAREHMERGQGLYAAGRFIESAEEFLRAYEAQPYAAFLFNAGVAYEKVGDPGRAADYFARYLSADPQAEDAKKVSVRIERLRGLARAQEQELAAQQAAQQASDSAQAQEELEAAKRKLEELQRELAEARAAQNFKSLLSVQTKPEDATISIKDASGNEVVRHTGSPLARSLDEGRYFVEVEHPKYKTISTPLTVAAGKVYVIITELSQGQFLGFLRVVTNVPGASVFVDKKEEGALGKTPFQNATTTGIHRVWIEKPGYKPVERDVEIGVGDDLLLKLDIERVDHGRVRVVANTPEAQVFIDGVAAGGVPLEKDLSAGEHSVRVSAPNMKDWKETVKIERGQATPIRVRMRPKVGRAGAWVTAGVSVAFLGAAIATGVVGHRLEKDLESDQRAGILSDDDPRLLRGKLLYISSNVGYGLSAAMAGLATYYFLRDPLPDSEGRVLQPRDWAFAPVLSPEHAGGNLHVSF